MRCAQITFGCVCRAQHSAKSRKHTAKTEPKKTTPYLRRCVVGNSAQAPCGTKSQPTTHNLSEVNEPIAEQHVAEHAVSGAADADRSKYCLVHHAVVWFTSAANDSINGPTNVSARHKQHYKRLKKFSNNRGDTRWMEGPTADREPQRPHATLCRGSGMTWSGKASTRSSNFRRYLKNPLTNVSCAFSSIYRQFSTCGCAGSFCRARIASSPHCVAPRVRTSSSVD